MICWYCHWGWAKPAAEIYLEAVELLGGDSFPLHYGPSHIVWEDENWDCVQTCLDNFDDWDNADCTEEELAIVRWSLERLLELPLESIEIEPKNYDGENPQNYPPAVEVVRV